jgi:hypothetical protein
MTTFVTAFIDISEEEQAQELKEYWISHGASFDDELGTDGDICRLVLSAASSFSACLANASDEGICTGSILCSRLNYFRYCFFEILMLQMLRVY